MARSSSVPQSGPVVASTAPRRVRPPVPRLLGERIRPLVIARDELLPVATPFTELLGTPGLRRGSTLAVVSGGAGGATSLALGLVGAASAAGAWCAAVGLGDLGCVAADEFGLVLDRLVLVPRPGRRASAVLSALVDGYDVVLFAAGLSTPDRRRLSARARERRSVLVELVGSKAATFVSGRDRREGVDVVFSVTGSAFNGLRQGSGRLETHLLDVIATRRSASPREVSGRVCFATSKKERALEISFEVATDARAKASAW